MTPPNMRPELVKVLRDAFNKTVKDPEFLTEAKKKKLELDPTTGEEVAALAKEVTSQPKDGVDNLKKLMASE